jgi:uncharacterized iron-regulated membrane protein
MRAGVLTVHRYLSLAVALFWILQALTGVLLVFRWELDDGLVAGAPHQLDLAAIERRIAGLKADRPGWAATAIWSSGSRANRYDITLEDPSTGEARTWRVDGDGKVLRVMGGDDRFANGAFFDTLTSFHQTLLLGDRGRWLIGASGLLLASNILLAVALALPARGRWRAALLPRARGGLAGWSHAWHRALGLWLMIPAAALALCGAALSFEDPLRAWLGAEVTPPAAALAAGTRPAIGPALAIKQALARHPDASVSGVVFPSADTSWYRIRLLQAGEPRQTFGRTTVYVSGGDGRVLRDYDTLRAPWRLRLFDLLYPLHTGQAVGAAGRAVALLVGLWLAAMCGLGVLLWSARRRTRSAPSA